ncbi:hypothetical protein EPR50_G00113760 [Perca flavescens]|uniref:Ig-like domain-containing protein n=1 Tax=Perca flavescens TaxID=8167 RepID=A0A484CUL0_PERFV|nr:hypothetical protein EPR50_G00113760 [Perca flavescens]
MSDVRLALASSPVSTETGPSPGCSSHGNEPPAFILPPRNARVALGGDARLEGKVRGHPEPQVTWLREGRAVIGGERCVVYRGARGTFSLVVGGVREEDAGRYTCQATNQAGSRQVTVEILLEENLVKKYGLRSSMKTGCPAAPSIWGESPSKFVTKPTRVFAKPGQTAKFNAKTTGRPPPRVTWYKGEAELQSCGRVRVYERSGLHFLEIQEVSAEDAGSYTCSVSNGVGTATATTTLTVQGEPTNQSPGSSARSTLNVEGVPGAPRAPRTLAEWPRPGEKEQQSPLSSWRSRPAVQRPLVAERRTAALHSVLTPDPVRTGSVQQPISISDSSRAERRSNLRFEAIPLDQEATEGLVCLRCRGYMAEGRGASEDGARSAAETGRHPSHSHHGESETGGPGNLQVSADHR